jgi:protein-disulfide isomerase
LCPHCGAFENEFGPTINDLIDSGAVAADYYMVAILDRPQNQNYSLRAGAAAYCVADESTDTFRRFRAAHYAQQPSETATAYPTDAQLSETARETGAQGTAFDCIKSGRYAGAYSGAGTGGQHQCDTYPANPR